MVTRSGRGVPLWIGLAVVAGLFIQPSAHAAETYSVKTVKDLSYYDGTDRHKTKHNLDLYLPDGVKNFPVLFFVHGGAWVSGDKDFFGLYASLAKCYAKQGIGVVVTNYRLSPAVKHPEHVKDVARALAWTHKNIKKHGGNPDALILCGHSAGAHLVSLLTTDRSYLAEVGMKTSMIKGVVPISGPFDIPDGFMKNVFGDHASKASPKRFARDSLPPFLILYADKDMLGCDKIPAEAFCKALKDKKVKAETLEIKNSNHLAIVGDAGTAEREVSKVIVKFIRAHAGK